MSISSKTYLAGRLIFTWIAWLGLHQLSVLLWIAMFFGGVWIS